MSADNGITIKKCLDGSFEVLHWQGDSTPHPIESFSELENAVRFASEQKTEYGISFIEETVADKQLGNYYVMFRDQADGDRLTQAYRAENFAHAEEQAMQDVPNLGQIVSIDLDY